jgi:catenin alpha
VDDLLPLGPQLALLEASLLADLQECCRRLQNGEAGSGLAQRAGRVSQAAMRVCDLVMADLAAHEEGAHTPVVLGAVAAVRSRFLADFSRQVTEAAKKIKEGQKEAVEENEFIEAARMVYDGVRDIRRATLMYRPQTDEDDEITEDEAEEEEAKNSLDINEEDTRRQKEVAAAGTGQEVTTIREAMQKLPDNDRLEICRELEAESSQQAVYWVAVWSNPRVRSLLATKTIGGSQVDGLHEEKEQFDREVAKWEDRDNDIVALAKHMCRIMMDMADFIKGRGKLKTTADVIEAAQAISEAGKRLDALGRRIADNCPESATKSDLLAYLQRIALYCHQLSITSKVKADVHSVTGEFIVSGLDSASSLIQAARNLMNAVVLTVKACYVACRMYRGHLAASVHPPGEPAASFAAASPTAPPVVVWRMKTPEKLPLVRREAPEEFRARIKRAAPREQTSPMRALDEFHELDLSFSTTSTESLASVDSRKLK